MPISQIIHKIRGFFLQVLDILFPKSIKVEELEKMTLLDWQKISTLGEHEGILYFFPYQNKYVRDAIWEIKYRRNEILKEKLITIVIENMLEEIGEKMIFENFGNTIVTSIPQSRQRKNERGYNQGEDIGRARARDLSLPFLPLLSKTRDTPRQTTLKRSSRLLNMKNSFAIKDGQNISGKNIIIVDDVVTTGATLNEARKTLRASGAHKIVCVAVAH